VLGDTSNHISATHIRTVPNVPLSSETDEFAAIGTQKKTLTNLGYVFLGAEFETIVEPLMLPADPEDNRGAMMLRGFTRNETVLALYNRFLDDRDLDRFDVGPVALP